MYNSFIKTVELWLMIPKPFVEWFVSIHLPHDPHMICRLKLKFIIILVVSTKIYSNVCDKFDEGGDSLFFRRRIGELQLWCSEVR